MNHTPPHTASDLVSFNSHPPRPILPSWKNYTYSEAANERSASETPGGGDSLKPPPPQSVPNSETYNPDS